MLRKIGTTAVLTEKLQSLEENMKAKDLHISSLNDALKDLRQLFEEKSISLETLKKQLEEEYKLHMSDVQGLQSKNSSFEQQVTPRDISELNKKLENKEKLIQELQHQITSSDQSHSSSHQAYEGNKK